MHTNNIINQANQRMINLQFYLYIIRPRNGCRLVPTN